MTRPGLWRANMPLGSDGRNWQREKMCNLVNKAREFAREKHAAQLRRYTEHPYFVHLEEVAGLVECAGLSENAIAAAWLHDVVEDQDVSVQAICANFNPEVA